MAEVGLSEAEARRIHGAALTVIREPFARTTVRWPRRPQTGELKLMIVKGRPVGAALLGPGAGEMIAFLGAGHRGQGAAFHHCRHAPALSDPQRDTQTRDKRLFLAQTVRQRRCPAVDRVRAALAAIGDQGRMLNSPLRAVPDPDGGLRADRRGLRAGPLCRALSAGLSGNRLERAQLASLAVLADDAIDPELERELLTNAGVFNVVLRRDEVRQLALASPIPEPISATFDIRRSRPRGDGPRCAGGPGRNRNRGSSASSATRSAKAAF